VATAPVATALPATPVVETPAAETPVVEPPVVEPPVAEAPAMEPPVVEPPIVEPPVVEPPVPLALAQPAIPPVVETLVSAAEPPQEQPGAPQPPALPVAAVEPLEAQVARPTSISLPPPAVTSDSTALRSQLAAAQARVISAVPPRWIEVAREHPVLWMAVAPISVASLFVLLLLAFEPPRAAVQARPALMPAVTGSVTAAAPAPAPAAAVDKPAEATLAELESKAADTLSVTELLLLNEGRAERKRGEVQALSLKLRDQAELVKDEALQAQLQRLAADPDTAETALAAMAQARSPVGPDLLYQVWTSPAVAAGTAELARSLLYSREVRPNASPALAAALQLRAADSCEAVKAALPQASSDGDRRSLSPLAKLNSRRGCGAKKNQDCYPCLRADMKQVVSAINAAKRRPAPSYSTR
jgi:hypothetical protein